MKNQIEALKKEKNAVILAHYYAPDEVQAIADFVGDSFYLAKVAKASDAETIIFCGVAFMGESAKILCPDKNVLMPDMTADCPMAHMVSEEKIRELRNKYDDLAIVCYINSTARLKCLSDVCVTSSNAVKIVRSLPNKNIFFIPDKNLGSFVAREVPEKNIILNDGCCPIHAEITVEQVKNAMKEHPDAQVLCHPECNGEIVKISHFSGSTAEIIDYAKNSGSTEFIVCTEAGVDFKLRRDNPDKRFYFPSPCPKCKDMKLNTPEKVLEALKNGCNRVQVDEAVRAKALLPLEKMLELGK